MSRPDPSLKREVFRFLVGFLGVLVASAFLAPWLATFLPFKFNRILRRLIMIGTLALVFWFLRVRRTSLSRLGLGWPKESLRLLGLGFGGGIFVVAAITVVQFVLGARFWHIHETDVWHWIGFFLKGFGAGLLIGLIEEFFFRGFLFLTLEELWTRKASLLVTNLIYALVHFFPKGGAFVGPEPTAADSFRILGSILFAWFRPEILPALLGLFLFGLLLSFVFLRAGSLVPAIGVHAGAVFALKLNRRFLPEISGKMGILSGSKNLYDGIAGLITLTLAAFWLGRGVGRRPTSSFRGKGLLLASILFLLFPPLSARAAEGGPPGEILFSFLQELPHAEAVREGEEGTIRGEWADGRFYFEGLPGSTYVFTTENIAVDGKTRMAIWFQPWKGFDSTLTFSSVPPGRRLRLFFALGDSDFSEGKAIPVYFEVWLGKKKLFDAQVGTKGWKQKTFDLTLVYLLQRKYRFKFRTWSSERRPTNFVFYGYVE